MDSTIKQIARVSYHQAADSAARHADPDARGAIVAAAARLDPLHRIQVAADQMVRQVNDMLRERGRLPEETIRYLKDEFTNMQRLEAILRTAAEAAESMVVGMAGQVMPFMPGIQVAAPSLPAEAATGGADESSESDDGPDDSTDSNEPDDDPSHADAQPRRRRGRPRKDGGT